MVNFESHPNPNHSHPYKHNIEVKNYYVIKPPPRSNDTIFQYILRGFNFKFHLQTGLMCFMSALKIKLTVKLQTVNIDLLNKVFLFLGYIANSMFEVTVGRVLQYLTTDNYNILP